MSPKNIEALAKEYGFDNKSEYFDYFAAVHTNGQFSSLREHLGMIRSVGAVDALVSDLEEMGRNDIIAWVAKN